MIFIRLKKRVSFNLKQRYREIFNENQSHESNFFQHAFNIISSYEYICNCCGTGFLKIQSDVVFTLDFCNMVIIRESFF